jgi:hypothetical protein
MLKLFNHESCQRKRKKTDEVWAERQFGPTNDGGDALPRVLQSFPGGHRLCPMSVRK